jgi:hypothetical protein
MTGPTRRKSRFRFLRFGLRGLLGLVTLVALGLGAYRLFVVPHRQERAFLEVAAKTDASVTVQRWWTGETLAWTPDLELGWLDRIVAVDFSGRRDFTPEATDEVVALLSGLPSLRELDLSHGNVSGIVLGSLDLPELRKLALRQCLRVEVLRLSRMPRLEELDASASGLQALDCAGLANLRAANLSRTRITHDAIAQLSQRTQLSQLNLTSTPVTGEGLGLLPPSIEELALDHTVLDEPGVAHLARLPELKHVLLPVATREAERNQESRLRQALPTGVKVWSGVLERSPLAADPP